MRAIAALSVLTGHVWQASQDGHADLGNLNFWVLPYLPTGLTLFFAISGFLLWPRFAAAVLDGRPLPSVGAYARSRFFRIMPAYWVILLLVGLVIGAAYTRTEEAGYLTDPALLAANLVLVQSAFPEGVLTGIGPSWSLAVEIVFYVSLPLFAVASLRLAPRIGRVPAALMPAAVLLVLGIAGKTLAWNTLQPGDVYPQRWGPTGHAVLERSFLVSADLFAFGMVAAVVVLLVERGRIAVPRRLIGGLAVMTGGLCVGLAHFDVIDDRYFDTAMSLACALLLLYVALPGRERSVSRVLELRPIVYVGVISYSIYLWHQPLMFWLKERGLMLDGAVGFSVNLVIVVAVSLALAAVTYRFVERPAMRRKTRVATHSPAMEAAP